MGNRKAAAASVVVSIAVFAAVLAAGRIYQTSPQGPRLVISPAQIHFGTVFAGEVIRRSLLLRNTGTEPIRIAAIRTNCGCASTRLRQSTIQPGEELPLDIALDTSRLFDSVSKCVYVSSNDPHGIASAKLVGYVRYRARCEPEILFVEDTRSNRELGCRIRFLRELELSEQEVEVVSDTEDISASIGDWTRHDGHEETEISVAIRRGHKKPGLYSARLTTRVGDAVLPVQILYELLPRIKSSPAAPRIRLDSDGTGAGEVVLQWPEDSDGVVIHGAKSVHERCDLRISEAGATQCKLRIAARPDRIGSSGDTDIVQVPYTTAPGSHIEVLQIPVTFVPTR